MMRLRRASTSSAVTMSLLTTARMRVSCAQAGAARARTTPRPNSHLIGTLRCEWLILRYLYRVDSGKSQEGWQRRPERVVNVGSEPKRLHRDIAEIPEDEGQHKGRAGTKIAERDAAPLDRRGHRRAIVKIRNL